MSELDQLREELAEAEETILKLREELSIATKIMGGDKGLWRLARVWNFIKKSLTWPKSCAKLREVTRLTNRGKSHKK